MILFAFHQIYVQPYSTKVLNNIETVSLLMLIVICIVNTVPGYIYVNSLFVSWYVQHLLTTLRKVETALLLIAPFIVGLCLCAIVVIQILQFLYWMFKICTGVISFCFITYSSIYCWIVLMCPCSYPNFTISLLDV